MPTKSNALDVLNTLKEEYIQTAIAASVMYNRTNLSYKYNLGEIHHRCDINNIATKINNGILPLFAEYVKGACSLQPRITYADFMETVNLIVESAMDGNELSPEPLKVIIKTVEVNVDKPTSVLYFETEIVLEILQYTIPTDKGVKNILVHICLDDAVTEDLIHRSKVILSDLATLQFDCNLLINAVSASAYCNQCNMAMTSTLPPQNLEAYEKIKLKYDL